MPTSFSFDQVFAADPAAVLAMLRDPDYVRHKAEQTGGRDVVVEVTTLDATGLDATGLDATGFVIVCTRTLPAEVPSYARSFVGDTITITERQEWRAAGADALPAAAASVDFHAPVAYSGRIDLAVDGSGTIARNTGSFRASVPFVGGKVERLVAEQTQRYLAKETQVAAAWLARA